MSTHKDRNFKDGGFVNDAEERQYLSDTNQLKGKGMKTYRVYASQLVFYTKEVQANSIDEANEIAWESQDTQWEECQWADWAIETEDTREINLP
jgi:hypothetical protein